MPRSIVAAAAWLVTFLAVLPVLFHWQAASPRISRTQLAWDGAYAISIFICWLIYRAESQVCSRRCAIALVSTILLLTLVINNVHSYNVDQVTNLFPYETNEKWQETLQNDVINLVPGVAPHSYRFLPNGIVRWLEMGHVGFRAAADIYRFLTGILLFYVIYRFARLYTTVPGAIIAMSFVALMFPVSFEFYAGQLTDPLSHLSFVLAFIFLATDNFLLFLTTLLIGSLAKETVLAMAGYYILFPPSRSRYWQKTTVLCLSTFFIYFGIRYFVLHGAIQYQNISGVDTNHIADNFKKPFWGMVFFLTVAGGAPILGLGWKRTPAALKKLYFYLTAVLFVSSLCFSWLREARNYMPVVIVLGVIAGCFWAEYARTESADSSEARRARGLAQGPS